MVCDKKSFIIHLDSLEILEQLTDEQAGKLLKAFRDYHTNKKPELDQFLSLAFFPFEQQFKRDNNKYQTIVERNKTNGSRGGRPSKPKKPTGLNQNPNKPKKADNDSVNDSVNDNDSDSVNEYAFLGETIRLNHSDFLSWQKLYPNLNLTNELRQLDMECRGDKKWFMSVSAKLNYRNKNAQPKPQRKMFSQ